MIDSSIPIITKPVRIFSNLFAVFPLHANLNMNFIGVAHTTIVLVLCLVHLYFLPGIMIDIERSLTKVKKDISYNYFLKMLFPTVVFVTSFISKISSLFLLKPNLLQHSKLIHQADQNLRIKEEDIKRHFRFSVKVVCIISSLTFPINLIRVKMFLNAANSWESVLLFGNMYYQNISTCFHEAQFTTATYGLLIRVRKVNKSLKILLDKQDVYFEAKYNETLTRKEDRLAAAAQGLKTVSEFGLRDVSEEITVLRHIHRDLGYAAVSLQKAYGLTLLFALCCHNLMLLFDIYFEFYGFIGGNAAKPNLATYVWCLQYSVRFVMIVDMAQRMYDEVTLPLLLFFLLSPTPPSFVQWRLVTF